ncbi:MAG: hypothetical protein JWR61_3580 [Ferruginibacter sp.]|nr:hypothetical protein [Ferruginibacter sp.]
MNEDLLTLTLLKWLVRFAAVSLVLLIAYLAYDITMAGN